MIPCIESKCLKYPVCKSKSYISCEDLSIYFHLEEKTRDAGVAWDKVEDILPKIKFLHPGKINPDPEHYRINFRACATKRQYDTLQKE